MKLQLYIRMICLLTIACGVEVGNPKKPTETATPDNPQSDAFSQQATSEVITASVDETLASVSENLASYNDTALMLTGKVPLTVQLPEINHTCEENASTGEARVTRSISFENQKIERRNYFYSSIDKQQTQATWTPIEGPAVVCRRNRAHVRWLVTKKVGLKITFDRERERIFTARNEEQTSKGRNFTSSGERDYVWQRLSDIGETDLVTTYSLSKRIQREQKSQIDDDAYTISTTISTSDDKPLVIEETRSGATRMLTKRLIKSGTVTSAAEINGKKITVTTAFDNITIGKDGCFPVEGRMHGTISFPENEDKEDLTYTINFDAINDAELVFSTEDRQRLTLASCDDSLNDQ